MHLKDLGEERLIKDLGKRFPSKKPNLIKSIGDDCCVVRASSKKVLLATTDILIEGVHFKKAYAPPYLLGRKSISISLSDIAAMGGRPGYCLVSIAMPGDTLKSYVDELYRGIKDSSLEFGCRVAGGNTARLPGRVMIGTTVFGTADKGRVVFRSGAKPGHKIFVTGTLGDSALGLKILGKYGEKALKGPFGKAALKHLDPVPRIKAGLKLSSRGLASAMIDLSDGLMLDLKRLCESSGVSAVVEADRLPLSRELTGFFPSRPKMRTALALTGGEDYELLFTAPKHASKDILGLSRGLRLKITEIGSIAGAGSIAKIRAIDSRGAEIAVKRPGFAHF